MRLVVFFLFLVLLTGCTQQVSTSYDVVLFDSNHSDVYDEDTKIMTDTISFKIRNDDSLTLDCVVNLEMSNSTNSTRKQGNVGILEPEQVKEVKLSFQMFYGDTDLSIKPDCRPAKS
jgi:hypothetical protein